MKQIATILFLLIFLTGCTKNTMTTNTNENDSKNQEVKEEVNLIQEQIKKMGHEDLVSVYDKAVMKTNLGDIKIKFYNSASPVTVNNFLNLAKTDFYNGTKFHRVMKDFMIQGGDPLSKDDNWAIHGSGGPDYKFDDEFNNYPIVKGNLAMANSGPNTNGSQFFIVTAESTPWLDGKHTNFGEVTEGMEVVEKIEVVETNERDHPLEDIIVESIELIAK
jgi:cyclophilin family peptidyl-prolyl cis-trans isomerase